MKSQEQCVNMSVLLIVTDSDADIALGTTGKRFQGDEDLTVNLFR